MAAPEPTRISTSVPGEGTNGVFDGNGEANGLANGQTSVPETPKQMPLAIVGMSCRLPGNVATPDEFWELCSRARHGWSEMPKHRFENGPFHHPNPGKSGTFNPVGGCFLQGDLGLFDAPFFSLTAQEATSLDPQQRLLLECTFEALDSAGIPKHSIVGKDVGVFIGGSFSEYESQLFRDPDTIPMYQATGCSFAMQSNRISHFFDLRGPSFTMDTACSSSLVALHLACQSLRNGESTSAIVGGCHLNILPEFWISMSMSRLFSDEGRSFSFDSRGTGYGRGEGCGMVVLKPLDQALKDNDTVRAVIVGSGINQDGKTPGITMPSGDAQEALIRQVYANAGIDPADAGVVEAHGTGTRVGDPIEAKAIHAVLGKGRTPSKPLFIGSVKSNIGHLEAASGIISVIKSALMLERGFILPNYDFKKPNEKIPFAKWNLKVPVSQRPWPRPKRFVSVNNFGFGGTNAHVVLEKAPFVKKAVTGSPTQATSAEGRKLFVLSANDKPALETMMKKMGVYLEQRPEIFQHDLMSNVAYTLGQRRSLMQWRAAIPAQLSFELNQVLSSGKLAAVKELEEPRIGMIFTGQGAQWWAMGKELYEQYPVYAASINKADKMLTELGASFSLIEELSRDEKTSAVGEAHISQPSCTAVQLALVDLMRSWDIRPTAVAGHSSGEIGAAYAAGILTHEACMAIAYHRGRVTIALKKKFPELRGAMMAVGGSPEDIAPLIAQIREKEVKIACINSPSSVTVSGDAPAVSELQKLIEDKQMFNRKLQVDMAYHSHHMELVADDYLQSIEALTPPVSTDVKFHSSLLGHLVDGTRLTPSYWVENLTCPVRFSEALASMSQPVDDFKTGMNIVVEVGPHAALAGPVKQILKAVGGAAAKVPYAATLVRKRDAVETALELAATLFMKGAFLDLGAINFPRPGKTPSLLIDMPRYQWNHQTKYWHESRMTQKHKNRASARSDIIGTIANYSNDLEPTWRNIVRIDDLPWLRHHKVQGMAIFPMSAFISMALEAAAQRAETKEVQYDSFELRDVSVHNALVVTDDDFEMTITLRQFEEGVWDEFRIHSWAATKGWTEHCKGFVAVRNEDANEVDGARQSQTSEAHLQSVISDVQGAQSSPVNKTELYDTLSELGVSYGPTFQGLDNCQASKGSSTADITVRDTAAEMPQGFQTSTVIHPAFLEQLIEMYWPILGASSSLSTVYLPSSIGKLTVSRDIVAISSQPGNTLQAFCRGDMPSLHPMSTKVSMFASSTEKPTKALISIQDLTIAPIVEREMLSDSGAHRELCYKLEWEPILHPLHGEDASAVSNGVSKFPTSDIAIVHGSSQAQIKLASIVAASVESSSGKKPEVGTLMEINTDGKLCIFLSELDEALLANLTSSQFTALQMVLTTVQGVLWVVRGAYLDSQTPESNMVTGLSRSIRSETLLKFGTLDLDAKSKLSDEDTAKAVIEVFKAIFGSEPSATGELEFVERAGSFLTPRIVNDAEMNEYVHKQTSKSTVEPTAFGQDARSLKMVLGTPGALDTLHFVDNDDIEEPLAEDEIELEVKAIGLNDKDLQTALGQLPTNTFGIECSGVVAKTGKNVIDLSVGDRVACLSEGVFATHARAKAALSFKVAQEVTFEASAAAPIAYSAAYYSLVDIGRLGEGEIVLIQSAASAIGQAAIVVAKKLKAEIFATVNDIEEKKLLVEKYSLPEDHIFHSGNLSFSASIHQVTAGKGVDVVLSSVSGEKSSASYECMNSFGRFVEIGKSHSMSNEVARLNHNASFTSVDLAAIASLKPKLMQRLLADASGVLNQSGSGISSTSFPISDVETAFKLLQSGKFHGNLVVVPHPEDQVKATPSKLLNKLLRPDATYVLIGGTGGLGRSMTRWMVGKGAKNIVLVSRSGSATGKVKELIDEFSQVGANIVVRRCNVADKQDVDNLVATGLTGLPPVAGVVHGAMVLRDVLFEKMTCEEYTTVIESKVKGAWNFHHALQSTPLDFFVVISSAAGAVGNRGQAAYSAANTFLNSFAQYRLARGQHAASIDLTAVSDAGYLANNLEAAAEVARNLGSDTICEAEVLALLGAAINGRLATACNSHTITGMRITPTQNPFWTTDAKFLHLRLAAEAEAAATSGTKAAAISFNSALKAAKSLPEAEDVICKGLVDKIAAVLMLEMEDMDITRPLSKYALDSLVAIEIRNFITREFEANMQVLELLASGCIENLAKGICVKSKLVNF